MTSAVLPRWTATGCACVIIGNEVWAEAPAAWVRAIPQTRTKRFMPRLRATTLSVSLGGLGLKLFHVNHVFRQKLGQFLLDLVGVVEQREGGAGVGLGRPGQVRDGLEALAEGRVGGEQRALFAEQLLVQLL